MAADTIQFIDLPSDPPPSAGIEYRVLTPDEVASSVAPIFAAQNSPMPNPASSFFVGAVDPCGLVVGFLTIQACIHAQPMWIDDAYKGAFSAIVQQAENEIAKRTPGERLVVYLFTPAGHLSRLAQLSGMAVEPWVVHSKVVEGVPLEDAYQGTAFGTVASDVAPAPTEPESEAAIPEPAEMVN